MYKKIEKNIIKSLSSNIIIIYNDYAYSISS